MKNLLMTTTLISLMSLSPALAQTAPAGGAAMPAITAPEGYTLQETMLTTEMLVGADIYDSAGDSIGKVSDLVFDLPASDAGNRTGNAAAGGNMGATGSSPTPKMDVVGNMTGGSMPESTGTSDAATATEGANATTNTGMDSSSTSAAPGANTMREQSTGDQAATSSDESETITMGTSGADNGTDAPIETPETGSATPPGTAADATSGTAGAGMDTQSGAATSGGASNSAGSDASQSSGAMGAGTSAETASPTTGGTNATTTMPATASTSATMDLTSGGDGRITHAIIDVGGFLGMGVHTVAVPVSDLAIYADSSDNARVYLPWSREQLEALPAYEPGNLDTLGRSSLID